LEVKGCTENGIPDYAEELRGGKAFAQARRAPNRWSRNRSTAMRDRIGRKEAQGSSVPPAKIARAPIGAWRVALAGGILSLLPGKNRGSIQRVLTVVTAV
jgi:hypothetical protein